MSAARFAITGTGHSGTAWLTLALSMLGIPTTHEGVYTLAGPRPWPYGLTGEVSVAATPYLLKDLPTGARRAIVVRDPLAVAQSFYRGRNFAFRCPCHPDGAHLASPLARYALEHLKGDGFVWDRDDELGNTLRYVLAWHHLAASPYTLPRGSWLDTGFTGPIWRLEDLAEPATGLLGRLAATLTDASPIHATDLRTQARELLTGPWLAPTNAHGPTGDPRPELDWPTILEHPHGTEYATHALELGYTVG